MDDCWRRVCGVAVHNSEEIISFMDSTLTATAAGPRYGCLAGPDEFDEGDIAEFSDLDYTRCYGPNASCCPSDLPCLVSGGSEKLDVGQATGASTPKAEMSREQACTGGSAPANIKDAYGANSFSPPASSAELDSGAESVAGPPSADASSSVIHWQYLHSMRSTFSTASTSIPALMRAASIAKGLLAAAMWPAAFVFFIWMWGGVLAWLAAAGAGLLARWAFTVATRRAMRRIIQNRAMLLQSAAHAALRLLAIAAPTATAAALGTYKAIRRTADAAGAAAARPAGSSSKRRRSFIGAAAALAWRACAFVAAAVLHACVYVFEAARTAAGVAIGMSLWWTCVWLSALCWAGLFIHEALKTAAAVMLWPFVRFTALFLRATASKG